MHCSECGEWYRYRSDKGNTLCPNCQPMAILPMNNPVYVDSIGAYWHFDKLPHTNTGQPMFTLFRRFHKRGRDHNVSEILGLTDIEREDYGRVVIAFQRYMQVMMRKTNMQFFILKEVKL